MPNQYRPDLVGPPLSLSPHLRFGTLSVRRFYWGIRDAYTKVGQGELGGVVCRPVVLVFRLVLTKSVLYSASSVCVVLSVLQS